MLFASSERIAHTNQKWFMSGANFARHSSYHPKNTKKLLKKREGILGLKAKVLKF